MPTRGTVHIWGEAALGNWAAHEWLWGDAAFTGKTLVKLVSVEGYITAGQTGAHDRKKWDDPAPPKVLSSTVSHPVRSVQPAACEVTARRDLFEI